MINSNVDQFGIPYKGFIKADKIRARLIKEYSETAALSAESASPEAGSLIDSLRSFRMLMIGAVAVLVLMSSIAYLVGENRGTSSPRVDTGTKSEMLVAMHPAATVIVVAGSKGLIENNERKMPRATEQQQTVYPQEGQQGLVQQNEAQSTRQSLLRLKQTLDPQSSPTSLNTNAGAIDDYSLSLSDPLSGKVVNQADSEMEKLRLRVISMIDSQSELDLTN